MTFGPVILIFYWPKKKISAQPKLALISGTGPWPNFALELGLTIFLLDINRYACDIILKKIGRSTE